ncbi:MAG: HAD family hydrolase [Candidatus Woesearchaeota archaeon]
MNNNNKKSESNINNNQQIKVYLFDLDGTLIDNNIYSEIYSKIIYMIKDKLGLSEEEIDRKAEKSGLDKNKSNRWDSGELCEKLGFLEEYYLILETEINLKKEKSKNILKIEIVNLLKQKKEEGKVVGIVSNSFTKTINLYLKKYELIDKVKFIFSSEDAECKKNEKEFWERLIEKEKLNPKECLVIGDNEIDDQKVPRKLGFSTQLVN